MILNKDTDCSFCPPSPFGVQTGHKTRPDDVFLWSDIPGVSRLMLESPAFPVEWLEWLNVR